MAVARVYDKTPGMRRILVDRLWPRGVSKESAALEFWAKELAPSTELRREFHTGLSFAQFEALYRMGLEGKDLSSIAGADVVLLTSSPSEPNHATILDNLRRH